MKKISVIGKWVPHGMTLARFVLTVKSSNHPSYEVGKEVSMSDLGFAAQDGYSITILAKKRTKI